MRPSPSLLIALVLELQSLAHAGPAGYGISRSASAGIIPAHSWPAQVIWQTEVATTTATWVS